MKLRLPRIWRQPTPEQQREAEIRRYEAMDRVEKIELLIKMVGSMPIHDLYQFNRKNLIEDCLDGTNFDRVISDAFHQAMLDPNDDARTRAIFYELLVRYRDEEVSTGNGRA